jgi:predicted RNase H-like HicB family nuclease
MLEFAVILTESRGEYVASCPDVPGCWGFGQQPDQALARLRRELRRHLKKRLDENLPVPASTSEVGYLDVGKIRGYAGAPKCLSLPRMLDGKMQLLAGFKPSLN